MQDLANAVVVAIFGFAVLVCIGVFWNTQVRCPRQHPRFGACVLRPHHRMSHVNGKGQRWVG